MPKCNCPKCQARAEILNLLDGDQQLSEIAKILGFDVEEEKKIHEQENKDIENLLDVFGVNDKQDLIDFAKEQSPASIALMATSVGKVADFTFEMMKGKSDVIFEDMNTVGGVEASKMFFKYMNALTFSRNLRALVVGGAASPEDFDHFKAYIQALNDQIQLTLGLNKDEDLAEKAYHLKDFFDSNTKNLIEENEKFMGLVKVSEDLLCETIESALDTYSAAYGEDLAEGSEKQEFDGKYFSFTQVDQGTLNKQLKEMGVDVKDLQGKAGGLNFKLKFKMGQKYKTPFGLATFVSFSQHDVVGVSLSGKDEGDVKVVMLFDKDHGEIPNNISQFESGSFTDIPPKSGSKEDMAILTFKDLERIYS